MVAGIFHERLIGVSAHHAKPEGYVGLVIGFCFRSSFACCARLPVKLYIAHSGMLSKL